MSDAALEAAAAARALRDQSDALNLRLCNEDLTDSDRDTIAATKRDVDAEAFALEQHVRELEEAAYGPDAVNVSVPAAPLNMNGGGF